MSGQIQGQDALDRDSTTEQNAFYRCILLYLLSKENGLRETTPITYTFVILLQDKLSGHRSRAGVKGTPEFRL